MAFPYRRHLSPLPFGNRFSFGLLGLGVVFACLGAGEAVYRLLFLDFDGATDRLPLELLFGVGIALTVIKLLAAIYRSRMNSVRLIRERNRKIRQAVNAIDPAPYLRNQQAIRVIREQVDGIDGAVTEIMTR